MPNWMRRDIPEPRPGEKHDTSHSQVLAFLLTVLAITLLLLIWRRTSTLKSVVQHRLRTLTSPEGAIRLPAEEGPPDDIFNEDEELDPNEQPLHFEQQIPKAQPLASSDQPPMVS